LPISYISKNDMHVFEILVNEPNSLDGISLILFFLIFVGSLFHSLDLK